MDAPPGTKVAVIYYFDLEGKIVEQPVPEGAIEITYWADEEMTERIGESRGTIVSTPDSER